MISAILKQSRCNRLVDEFESLRPAALRLRGAILRHVLAAHNVDGNRVAILVGAKVVHLRLEGEWGPSGASFALVTVTDLISSPPIVTITSTSPKNALQRDREVRRCQNEAAEARKELAEAQKQLEEARKAAIQKPEATDGIHQDVAA